MDQNPQTDPNYVVPREVIDFKTSFDFIEEITRYYLDTAAKKGKNANLEIEAKMGYEVRGKDQFSHQTLGIISALSDRDFIIINLVSPIFKMDQFFGMNTELINGNFEQKRKKIEKPLFQDIQAFFKRESKLFPQKIKESKNEFTIDFQMPDHSRVTYDLINNKWSQLSKRDKTSIDLLHKGNPYRISYCFEDEIEFDEEQFNIKNVKGVRIKQRKCFEFQYMEYSFTEVLDLTSQNNAGMSGKQMLLYKIKQEFMKSEKKYDMIMEKFVQLKLKMEEEYEIEVEVKDLGPLLSPSFSSFFRRFIRNTESLFYVQKILQNTLSKDILNAEERNIPVIGQYLNEIFIEK